jgi:PAS domain S-box-containing protein
MGKNKPAGTLQDNASALSQFNPFESILNNTDILAFFLDTSLNYLWVNSLFLDSCKIDSENLIGRNHFDLFPDNEKKKLFQESLSSRKSILIKAKPFEFTNDPLLKEKLWDWSLIPFREDKNATNGLIITLSKVNDINKYEEALSESQERYSAAFQISPFAIAITSLENGEYLEINDAFTKTTGYTREEIIGKTSKELALWVDLNDRQHVVDSIQQGKDVNRFEISFRIKNGNIRLGIFTARLLRCKNKNQILSSIEDITETRSTEKALNESDARFRNLMEDVQNVSVQGYKPDGTTFYWNKASERLYGYTADEAIGKKLIDLIIPDDLKDIVRAAIREMAETGIAIPSSELILKHKNGSKIPVFSSHTIIQVEGKEQELYCIDVDLSDRHNAIEELRKSEEYFKAIADFTASWEAWFSPEGKLLWMNPYSPVLETKSPEESLDAEGFVSRMVPHEDIPVVLEIFKSAMHGTRGDNVEIRFLKKDGSTFWGSVSWRPVFDSNGKSLGFRTSTHDITKRKEAEEEAKRIGEYYRALFEKAPDGIVLLDANAQYKFVSPAARKIFGYSENESISKDPSLFTHPDDLSMVLSTLQKLFTDPSYVPVIQYRYANKAGAWLWVESTFTNLLNDPIVNAIIINFREITDRKLAEEALKENEKRFREFFEANSDGITIFNINETGPPTVILDTNENAAKMLGYSKEDMLKLNPVSIESNLTQEQLAYRTKELKENGFANFETVIRHKDGHDICVETKAKVIFYNNQPALMNIVRDITERKLAQESLIESERRLKESQAVARLGSYVWNMKTGLWKSSKILDEIFGIDHSYIRSLEGWVKITHPDWQKTMNDYVLDEVLKNHKPFDKEYRIIRQDTGEERWVHGIGSLEFDDRNEPITLIGTISDITFRKDAEEEIRILNEELEHRVIQRTEQLEQSNKELEAFSYSVSHDLRAPVRHIMGFAEILKNECSDELSEKAVHYLETISGSAEKMGDLIDNLLNFSRTGRTEISKSHLNMNSILEDALNQIRTGFGDRKIKWNISDMPKVYGDYNLLRIVWINLLDNAVKYTRERKLSIISIGFKEEKKETIFFVRDNGVGFDMEYSGKLFGVFQRLHSASQFDGTGIGLANVRRIISRHGGKTWAEGEVENGAVFYFSLPKE